MAQIAYVDWDGLVYYDSKIKKHIVDKLEPCLKDGGQVVFEGLPNPDYDTLNYVYTITNDFITSDLFEIKGIAYSAGTAVKVRDIGSGIYRYTIYNQYTPADEINKFNSIDDRLDEHDSAIEVLEEKLATQSDEIHNLQNQIDNLPSPDLSDYVTVEEVETRFEDITDAIQSLNTKEEEDRQLLSVLDENMKALSATDSAVATQITTLSQTLNEVASTLDTKASVSVLEVLNQQVYDVNTQVELLSATKIDKTEVLEKFASKEYVKDSLSQYVSKDAFNEYKTEIDAKFIDTTELSNSVYETKNQLSVALDQVEEKIPTHLSQLCNDADLIDREELDKTIERIEEKLPTKISDLSNDTGFTTSSDVVSIVGENYYNKAEVDIKIANVTTSGSVDLSNYYNKQETQELINTEVSNLDIPSKLSQLENDTNFITNSSLEGLASKDYVASEIAKIGEVDLNGYAKEQWVKDQGYITDTELTAKGFITNTALNDYYTKEEVDNLIPSIDGLATTEYVNTEISKINIPDVSNFATKDDIPDISGKLDAETYAQDKETFALKSEIPSKVSELTNDAGYITESALSTKADKEHKHTLADLTDYVAPDLSNYVTKSDLELKANNVLFNDDIYVNIPIGSFGVGDSLKGMSIAAIITSLLGLTADKPGTPDDPEVPLDVVTVEDIKNYNIPVLSGSTASNDLETSEALEEIVLTSKTEAPSKHAPGTCIFYEYESEYGYIVYTFDTDRDEYVVAIPNGFIIDTIEMWDTLTASWVTYTVDFTLTDTKITNNNITYNIYESSQNASEEIIRIRLKEE